MSLTHDLVYVVSPQPWNGFQVSKHHYARKLAQRGWSVIFVDPPANLGERGKITLDASGTENIRVLRYQTFFPYKLKFRSRFIFDLLMRVQAKKLVESTGKPVLVWDFDNSYQFRDLRVFGARKTIFHLVDDVCSYGLGAKYADHFFSLHPSFCNHATSCAINAHIIPHGLAEIYVRSEFDVSVSRACPSRAVVGFVANLGAPWIDWESIAEMVRRHPEVSFIFWGPLPEESERSTPLKGILVASNSLFCGLTPPELIVEQSKEVDIWLLPFLSNKFDGGRPLNSHKVLEYLATGKVVLMSWLEEYANNPLVFSGNSPEARDLPDRFDRLLADLGSVNSPDQQYFRREYALRHSYDKHVDSILETVGLSSNSKF